MNTRKIRMLVEAFRRRDQKAVEDFNAQSHFLGASIEARLLLVEGRCLDAASTLAGLMDLLLEPDESPSEGR